MALRKLAEVRDDLVEWASSAVPRVPTGYSFFDDRTNGGIAPGEVALMIARTSVGKTWWALNVFRNNPDTPAIFFSLEMHGRYMLQRLAGIVAGVPTTQVEQDMREKGKSDAVDMVIQEYPHMMIEDVPGQTVEEMMIACDKYEGLFGYRPVLVAVDYLELVRHFGLSDSGETVNKLAQQMKEFARAADVALIVLHQVKRGESHKTRGASRGWQNQGHLPVSMSDGRFGGEMQADYFLGMYKPSLDPELWPGERAARDHDIRLQFLKTRTGGGIQPAGVQHYWDAPTGRITELSWS